MLKKAIAIPTIVLLAALAFFGIMQASVMSSNAGEADATATAAQGSLIAVHEAAGMDISMIETATYKDCSTCHDWEATVAATEDMWKGLGQITDANPHASHATNAFACSDCHVMNAPQINVCNQCHIFESPEGWVDKDKTTTNFGITATEPMF